MLECRQPVLRHQRCGGPVEDHLGRAAAILGAVAAHGHAVFGARDEKPFLTGLDAAGKPAWTFFDPALQPADEYEAVALKDQIFVASSTFVEGSGGKIVKKVRLLKLIRR